MNIPEIRLTLGICVLLLSASCSSKHHQATRDIEADFSRSVPTRSVSDRIRPQRVQNKIRITTRKPAIRAASYIMIDANSGRTIASQSADQTRAVASTQKLLTALTALDSGNLDKRITIARADTAVPPSKVYVQPGQVYTKRQMLNAALVKSGNDAAMVLARDHSGSASAFAAAMNRKAHKLGARNSHFVNPHGLTARGQYSTARDVARIAFAAYRNPTIRTIVRKPRYTLRGPGGPKTLKSTNKLLGRMPEANGMKTGYTNASGRCLVSSATSSRGQSVILVQLGSKTKYIFDDAEKMMRWGLGQGEQRGFARNARPASSRNVEFAAVDLQ